MVIILIAFFLSLEMILQKVSNFPTKFLFNFPHKFEMAARPSSDLAKFRREHLASAQHLVILTGAGVSAESAVPTFRGAGENTKHKTLPPLRHLMMIHLWFGNFIITAER